MPLNGARIDAGANVYDCTTHYGVQQGDQQRIAKIEKELKRIRKEMGL